MAPVAGRVANREKDWFIFASCFGESFFAPRIPINRIMRVLQKVRRLLLREPVRVLGCSRFNLCGEVSWRHAIPCCHSERSRGIPSQNAEVTRWDSSTSLRFAQNDNRRLDNGYDASRVSFCRRRRRRPLFIGRSRRGFSGAVKKPLKRLRTLALAFRTPLKRGVNDTQSAGR